ncbi:RNA polymerase sigma factor [Chitinispirillales bacterium ANBcel5]|uniref:RNA polymerase sigma factor n=1 Tax=Cellulosispirillum alkaliphilum TaxID=3039283 RepID=UPI002A54B3D5|nr:RNA polymerase sigma factor [Chitinispirillales bacterium ANBcel5]
MSESQTSSCCELSNLYRRYASVVHSRCASILKSEDEAWDATQEVFMKLSRSLPSIKSKNAIFSWLMSVSTNHCISQLRKRRLEEFNEAIHFSNPALPPQEKRFVMKELFERFMMPWDKKVREVLFYTYIDGYKQHEIAKLTGLGESTIRKYLTRFRRACGEAKVNPREVI